MELEIIEKKENPLLHRTEINFRIRFQRERTPSRADVRNMMAKNFSSELERVIIDHMRTSFGLHMVTGYCKIYENVDFAKRIEPDYILIRHGLKEKKGE
ncbi:MAG: 30S ribosomal protein S24e [Thermoplasmata archaeon]